MSRQNKKTDHSHATRDWLDDQQKRYHFIWDPQTQKPVVAPKAVELPECILRSNL